MQAPVELTPVSLDEMLQTQSFFAVGSVIAMPKVQINEPVVEPETFDLAAADPATPETAHDAASTLNTADAPPPKSAEIAAGAPVVEATPEPLPRSATPPR